MSRTGRPRVYHADRPATPAERQARTRARRHPAVPPGVVWRALGSCTLYCRDLLWPVEFTDLRVARL
jgi:hypothetical protein